MSFPAVKPARIFTGKISFICSSYALPDLPFVYAFLLSDSHLQAYLARPHTACQVKCLVNENLQHFNFTLIEFERRSRFGF
jgi:hypothetical protein